MRCSICDKKLIISGSFIAEDAALNSFHTNRHTCGDESCSAFGVVYWDDQGELYTDDYKKFKKLIFIDGLKNARGSLARKLEVECFKHDEDRCLYSGKKWGLILYVKYKANEEGDILKRYYCFRILKDNCWYTPGFVTLFRNMYRFHYRMLRHLFGKKISNWEVKDLRGDNITNNAWEYRIIKWYNPKLMNWLGV